MPAAKEGNVAEGEEEVEDEEEHGEDDDEKEEGGEADGENEEDEDEELVSAAKSGSLAVVKVCVAKGANVDVVDEVSSFKETTPLRDAGGSMQKTWRLLSLQTTCYCKPGNGHLENAPLSRTLFFLFEGVPARALSLSYICCLYLPFFCRTVPRRSCGPRATAAPTSPRRWSRRARTKTPRTR
jgi:hypothetical protein